MTASTSDCANILDDICPSCGFSKEYPDKPLCKYCWYRGTVGAAKLVLFQTMRDSGNKFRTMDELTELINAHPNRKYKITEPAVYKILRRYSRYYEDAKRRKKGYLVLKKNIPRKKGQRGRPKVGYKLSARLLKRLEKYEKRLCIIRAFIELYIGREL